MGTFIDTLEILSPEEQKKCWEVINEVWEQRMGSKKSAMLSYVELHGAKEATRLLIGEFGANQPEDFILGMYNAMLYYEQNIMTQQKK